MLSDATRQSGVLSREGTSDSNYGCTFKAYFLEEVSSCLFSLGADHISCCIWSDIGLLVVNN